VGDFVVAAADVLHERVPGGQDPRGPSAFQAAHRPRPGLQSAVISLHAIIGIALGDVQGGRDQLVQDPRVSRCPVGWL
jgi:hypothetical protein